MLYPRLHVMQTLMSHGRRDLCGCTAPGRCPKFVQDQQEAEEKLPPVLWAALGAAQ